MPAIGAYADLRAAKKRVLAMATAGCVLATARWRSPAPATCGWRCSRSSSQHLHSYGESLTAAFLPDWRAPVDGPRIGLGLELRLLRRDAVARPEPPAYVLWAQAHKLPATLRAGHDVDHRRRVRRGVVATFALLRRRRCRNNARRATPGCTRRCSVSWPPGARRYRDFSWLLACAACYQAGIAVVIALAAVYAEQVLGFTQTDTMMLIFLVNIAAALGAFGFGYAQDRMGLSALGVTLSSAGS